MIDRYDRKPPLEYFSVVYDGEYLGTVRATDPRDARLAAERYDPSGEWDHALLDVVLE